MSILLYNDGKARTHEFSDKVQIGSDTSSDVVLSVQKGIVPKHTVILRSKVNRLPLLIDFSGGQSRVNHQIVPRLRILRQGDELQLGNIQLTFWEVRIQTLLAGEPTIGRMCQVCTDDFRLNDEVIICPRCNTPHHRDCWFSIHLCATYGCEYPNHGTVMDALTPFVVFERELDENSELVPAKEQNGKPARSGTLCKAGNPRDKVPFQEKHQVAYCPRCKTPYHLTCFLILRYCSVCDYDVRSLLNRVFLSLEPSNFQYEKSGQSPY